MTLTESGQSRAAMLLNAARRSHFAARIQKYEAKAKQEQNRRALQREKQKIAMTLIGQQTISWQSLDSGPSLSKVQVRVEEFITSPSENRLEKECISGRFINMDRKDLERDTSISKQDPTSKGTHKWGGRAIIVSGLVPTEIKPSQKFDTYVSLKPSAALDVDIAAIAAALEVRIKKADMAGMMQEHAFQCARQCLTTTEKLMSKQMAHTLKKEFDTVYGPAWHCIVGKSFGSYVTHFIGGFLYFTMGKVSVLLFKTTVELVEHY
ncbi:hypothetical protein GOP47_0005029 [Adiantum capillus-veneris]|uniref:Dynein light chain n=1 Tax=Adiantum capillus-veneris TaxID=13818 RepID=A0A9D4V4Z3_ADICA|nr:hypothetical protein GOP47_0005029 [Adiantum capillus-veneris]